MLPLPVRWQTLKEEPKCRPEMQTFYKIDFYCFFWRKVGTENPPKSNRYVSGGSAVLLYMRGRGHRWEQVEANKSQKWTHCKYWNHTTKPKQHNKAWESPHGHPVMPMWVPWMLMAQAIVRLCSINKLIFAFLLQHRHNETPAVQEMMDSRKLFSIYWLQLCMEDNEGEWRADKRPDSHHAFQKKDCSLAGVVSIQSGTMVIFQIALLY